MLFALSIEYEYYKENMVHSNFHLNDFLKGINYKQSKWALEK